MVGCHLRYSNCLFTCSALLLLTVSFHDVEASSCQHVMIHKKVGDTVEFSSCLPTEGVTEAKWTYGGLTIVRKYAVSEKHRFTGRLYLNPTNFSLTVRSLTVQDSGDFIFLSEANDQQRPTVKVTLQVHEPITKQPVLTYNSTWHSSNGSCTFFLECSGTPNSNIGYNWTVRNQTRRGSRQQYVLREGDGDTQFTCTIYNAVSEKSTSETVKCSNETTKQPVSSSGGPIALIIRLVIALIIGVLLTLMLLRFTKSKGLCHNRLNQPEPVKQDETQQHVYSSLLHGDGSVYETMRGSEAPGTGGPPNQ